MNAAIFFAIGILSTVGLAPSRASAAFGMPSFLAKCLGKFDTPVKTSKALGLNRRFQPTVYDIAKGEIKFVTHGNPANPPLVLIHGLDSSYMTFENVFAALSEKFYVIALDQRGHGGSLAKGNLYSPDAMADDVAALLDHLKIPAADIVGHSLGGRTLLAFAEKYPDRLRRAIVEDMELHARYEMTAHSLDEALDLSEKMRADFENKTFASREELVAALKPYFDQESTSLTYRRAKENPDGSFTLLFRPWVTPLYSHLSSAESFLATFSVLGDRALVMVADPSKGTAISTSGLRRMQQINPAAKVTHFPGAGHTLHRADPEAFLKSLTDFLATPHKKKVGAALKPKVDLTQKLALSSFTPDPELANLKFLPLGSALVTSSGALEKQGIRQIIHAASGSMTKTGPKFDSSLAAIADSVSSSLELARRNGHRRVALPFIGGKIFAEKYGLSPDEIANEIVVRALRDRGRLELRFMTFGSQDTERFRKALRSRGVAEDETAQVIDGSIIDFKAHGATAIVNAANTEVAFGGGLSGIIGDATKIRNQIDDEAAEVIRQYYQP